MKLEVTYRILKSSKPEKYKVYVEYGGPEDGLTYAAVGSLAEAKDLVHVQQQLDVEMLAFQKYYVKGSIG